MFRSVHKSGTHLNSPLWRSLLHESMNGSCVHLLLLRVPRLVVTTRPEQGQQLVHRPRAPVEAKQFLVLSFSASAASRFVSLFYITWFKHRLFLCPTTREPRTTYCHFLHRFPSLSASLWPCSLVTHLAQYHPRSVTCSN